jgi:putative acyl-CoA dehydrogenase
MNVTGALPLPTHEVTNQPPPLEGYNAYEQDRALVEALHREGAGWAEARARELGGLVGSERLQQLARQANRYPPELRTHDRVGNRIDVVEYHPAYHELMGLAFGAEVHALAWTERRPGAHVARAVLSLLWNQGENGVGCPTGMAFGSVPALRHEPDIATEWQPKVLSACYDPRPISVADKTGATIGETLTEKQAGSDLRAVTTRALPRGRGGEYELIGHKWFCSAPMSDAFFTLAQTTKGPTCFFVPRLLPDGTRTRIFLQRLKDKCGNRSNASAELELDKTWARMVGEDGHGIRVVLEMSHLTRFDFAVGSAGIMRQALTQALHHAHYRTTFRHALVDQPLMRNVLADLAIESEAATIFTMRLARAYDESPREEGERLLARLTTPIAKYWICKRTPVFVAEALECLGGNGYVEEGVMPRLYREAPLNGIWEGVANMVCLDVFRAVQREPESLSAFLAHVKEARGADRRLDAFVSRLERELTDLTEHETRSRRVVEMMALVAQGALVVQHSPPAVADAFCASRLGGDWGQAFGTLPTGLALDEIIQRARIAP